MDNQKKKDQEIIESSPMGPALGIQTPEEKKQESKDRHNPQPAAPGDTV